MNNAQLNDNDIDLQQFSLLFFDECAEHLAAMEQILLSLADAAPNDEQLNAIFRAAHSIKGGAGTFGFEDMTIVTHVLESLLDRMRYNEIPFTAAMIDLFLEAGDVVSMQLAGHRYGSEVRLEAVDQVRAKLQQLIDGGNATSPASTYAASATGTPVAGGRGTSDSSCRRYKFQFTPDPDIFKRGIRLENLFAELEDLVN